MITHVTVVDVERGRLVADQTVTIRGNRIVSVTGGGGAGTSPSTRLVSGQGKFLIPGLWDMHVHLWNDSATANTAAVLLLANGVTGVRDMGGPLGKIVAWRDSVRSGKVLGPRAVVAGPVIDGPPPATEGDVLVRTVAEARRAVDSLANAGVDFIKAYEMLRDSTFRGVIDEARRRRLTVAGHLPLAVDAEEASSLGMTSFEHLRNLDLACASAADSLRHARVAILDSGLLQPGRPLRSRIQSVQRAFAVDHMDDAHCTAVLQTLAKNRTWQCATLFLDEAPLWLADSATVAQGRATEPYVPHDYAQWWEDQAAAWAKATPDARAPAERQARVLQSLVPRLRAAGVGLLAGTDAPNLFTPLGFSIHWELRALHAAGLSNLDALRTATLNPATFLRMTDSLGTIERGKLADLVLLDANPLADIANTARISAVIVNGRLLTRDDLSAMLSRVKRATRAPQG